MTPNSQLVAQSRVVFNVSSSKIPERDTKRPPVLGLDPLE